MALKGKFVVIGAGAMGGALLRGWIGAKLLTPGQVAASDLDVTRLRRLSRELGVATFMDLSLALKGASWVLLAVKPQQMKALLEEHGKAFPPKALVMSIAAGVSTAQIEKHLPQGNPVVRIMPNTPALVGAGMAGVSGGSRSRAAQVKTVTALFGSVGKALAMPERLLDAVTAVSGSGPAYFFRMIEALADAGTHVGLSRPEAMVLACQTALGAARMALETGKEPAELREQVTSPGGTTQAGLAELEKRDFAGALMACVEAAAKRAAELRKMND